MPGHGVGEDSGHVRNWAEEWLSAPRFAPYLDACSGNVDGAIELYEWNISLGQVLMRDIAHFEVALRNAYDGLMQERWDGTDDWLLDDTSPIRMPIMRTAQRGMLDVNRINRNIIDSAVAGLPQGFSHGNLVAALTLGFWVHLTDRSREVDVWRTHLYLAWPQGTNRADLQRRLSAVLRTRNRVAHFERLFNPSHQATMPTTVDADIIRLFRDLCPEAALELYGDEMQSPVARFLVEAPAPVRVVA